MTSWHPNTKIKLAPEDRERFIEALVEPYVEAMVDAGAKGPREGMAEVVRRDLAAYTDKALVAEYIDMFSIEDL